MWLRRGTLTAEMLWLLKKKRGSYWTFAIKSVAVVHSFFFLKRSENVHRTVTIAAVQFFVRQNVEYA